tara:strand:- start:442 stop:663 length:222 start_codon:yes stop_codon:yes gene_type:complete
MTRVKLTPKYNDNKAIREKIDKLLLENCCNVANSGTGSRKDIGNDEAVEKAWQVIQDKIKVIDPVFYEIIKSR